LFISKIIISPRKCK